MRLKTLEIKGFKSFADKTIINFSKDVIGVVGSNGCGKSNIVDAIRWVLGEQKTKQLRSDSMTNVIFNGTKHRKASGLAQVSLTFVNDKGILGKEYQEVCIQRSLFKDGSSEYKLNNIKCRLKDIHNLLSDTGMGADSYAIIALGMVDELLQDKENARLKLFEQAAGIGKYKTRKKETLSKLNSTDKDLDRVEDLLFEIEKNLKTLERQAKRARKYYDIKNQYKELSLEWSYFRISRFKESYKQVEIQLEQAKKEKEQLSAQLEAFEKRIQKEKQKNLDKEQQLSQAQQQLNRLVGKSKGLENDKKIIHQKLLFTQQGLQQAKEQFEAAQLQTKNHYQQLIKAESTEKLERDLAKMLNEGLIEAKKKLEEVQSKHKGVKATLTTFIQEREQVRKRYFEQEKKIAIRQNQQENQRIQVGNLQNRLNKRQAEVQGLLEEAEQYRIKEADAKLLLQTLKRQEDERKEQVEKNRQAVEQIKDEQYKTNRSLDAKRNEHRLLKGLIDNMEGYSSSIKFLAKNKAWKSDSPLLSDIFNCPEDYRLAVESYLDPWLSYYVVDNIEQAAQAIQLLDQHKKGKANFLILEEFQEVAKDYPLVGTPLLDILSFDKKYQGLAQELFGKVSLVEDFQVSQTIEKNCTYISKNGKYSQSKQQLSGGSVTAFAGSKIGRKKNLEQLEIDINTLKERSEEQRKKLQDLQEQASQLRRADQSQQVRKKEQDLQKIQRQSIALQSKVESFERFKQESIQQIQGIQQQLQTGEEERLLLKNDLQLLAEERRILQEKVQAGDEEQQKLDAELTLHSKEYNQKHIEQLRQENLVGNLVKEINFHKQQYKAFEHKITKAESTISQKQQKQQQLESEIQTLQTHLEEKYQTKKTYQENLSKAEKVYFASKGEIAAVEEKLRKDNRILQQKSDFIHQLEQKFGEIKLQLSSVAERLKVEFEIQINDILNTPPNRERYTEEHLEEEVLKIRKKLQTYGTINSMAIEAFDEMQERATLIYQQRKDLVDAKTDLLETMNSIEKKAKDKFMSAFTQVRTHFIQVFRSLFLEDDTCDLILTDPDNPLESKINIIAKPKGKRPLSINQLSGGEKTLTATALLFSLYLLKPAPFCIFDEVDAPLDDSNIAKFNRIIKEFSKNSQFIVVTHNKKTMEAVDILYGVTMVKGISKVVPTDFIDFEHLR